MKTGFIGTGAIAEAMIIGLIESGWTETVLVSARNTLRSGKLATRFANVRIMAENQTIVSEADVIFLSMLPNQANDVLQSMVFHENHVVVSLVAGISIEQLQAIVSPAKKIHRIIPMPPIEIGVGPIPVFPPSPILELLLGRIGTVISVKDEDHFSTFSASSALMATFFELVATNARWIESKGVSRQQSAMYSASLFHALALLARDLDPQELQSISQECLTAGGLNEQVLHSSTADGWFRLIEQKLEQILKRITS